MRRFSRRRRVFFFEEQIPTEHHLAYLELHPFEDTDVIAVRPRIPRSWPESAHQVTLARLLDQLLAVQGAAKPILWFYTPMMFPFAEHVDAAAVVYDCMDELSSFRFAPPDLRGNEARLLARADVVFTGGPSLYQAKRHRHPNVHLFPSSVDLEHFATARAGGNEPADQAAIPGPKFGFYGVIDERLDLDLLRRTAAARPGWSFVLIGPVVKIDPADLPRAGNIHYLGARPYEALPGYVAHWDVALMPFAINDATRFISPTKTPEYLAAGRPVVSTPIADVQSQYGDSAGVIVADTAEAFSRACATALDRAAGKESWLPGVDALLARSSWDETFARMNTILESALAPKARRAETRPYDYLIVGAGLAGSVLAERLAAGSGKRVMICDRRPHVAGNTYDFHDEAGILVHKYGPHIFHTNSEEVFAYLSRFTRWREYEHRVLARVGDKLLPMPINRTTLNGLFEIDLKDEAEAQAFLAQQAEPVERVETSRDIVISKVGTRLYRTFFEGYTRKQWGLDPSELDKSVAARLPARASTDDRYFLDRFQAMPAEGYTRMVENMLDHPGIDVRTGVDFEDVRGDMPKAHVIYTGPIDAYFDHRFGPLPYRSLEFRHETLDRPRFQPVAVVNYPAEDVPYTRVTEYKHLTGQIHPRTSISYEFARAEGEPYYPIPRPENQALYRRYLDLARQRSDVTFVGRLGTYKYYNMDQVVGQSLATWARMSDPARKAGSRLMAAGS